MGLPGNVVRHHEDHPELGIRRFVQKPNDQ